MINLPVWNMLMCSVVPKLLCQSEIDCIDEISFLSQTHQEIVWLDVAVDEVFAVNEFDSTDLMKESKSLN